MKTVRVSVSLIPAVALAACSPSADRSTGPVVTDSAGVEIVFSTVPAWPVGASWRLSADPVLSIGSVDGAEPYLFSNIASASFLPDGGLLVVNAARPPGLRVYDETGAHVRTVGAEGEGPGEFRIILRGWYDREGSLVAYDPLQGRISSFTLAGELIETRMIPALGPGSMGEREWVPVWTGRFGDGGLLGQPNVATPYENGRTRPLFPYTRLDLETLTFDTMALALGGEYVAKGMGGEGRGDSDPVIFSARSTAVPGDTTLFVSDTKDFWIEEYARGGRLVRRFGRSFEPRRVTQEDIDEHRRALLASAGSDDARKIVEERLRDEVVAETMPAHGTRMLLGASGNLWVSLLSRADALMESWSVFDAHGAYLGDVETPRELRLTDVRDDAVLGIWRDEFDVQTVRVYALFKDGQG